MLASLVLLPSAQGAQGTSVLGATTLPCTDELTRLMNRQLLRMTTYQFVGRVGVEAHARSCWTRGDPQLKTMSALPLPPLAGADKARWEALLAAHDGGAARFTARLNALSPEEQQRFAAAYKKLGQAFEQAQGKMNAAQDAALLKRITQATQPHRADILKLAGAR